MTCSYCGQPGGKTLWADEIGLHCSLCTPFGNFKDKAMKPATEGVMNTVYYNAYLHSDVIPFEVIRQVSSKTADIREMSAELVSGTLVKDPVWECKPNPEAPVVRIRLRKDGLWWDSDRGWRYKQADKPIKYEDPYF